MKRLQNNQNGLAQVALIIIAVLVVGVIGFTAYRLTQKKDNTAGNDVDNALSEAARAECEKQNDKDLCKFFTNWKASEQYRMTSTDSSGAKSVFEIDGNKTRMVMAGEMNYEVISIDQTTYTKAGDVWYKQTAATPDQANPNDYRVDFDEPAEEGETAPDKTTYKSLGKEACGSLNCFKYEVIDPDNTNEKNFIWFDDKDFKLRRSLTETSEGTSEMTFEYDNVKVSEPSPVKELGPNQYIVPGQTEPMTMPSAADFGM